MSFLILFSVSISISFPFESYVVINFEFDYNDSRNGNLLFFKFNLIFISGSGVRSPFCVQVIHYYFRALFLLILMLIFTFIFVS